MRDRGNPQRQTLNFAFEPRWAGAVRELKLKTVLVRLTADLEWPATVPRLLQLTIGDQPPRDVPVQAGLATVSGLDLDRGAYSGRWQVSLDLSVIRATPQLGALLDGGWLNPAICHDVELVDVCEATVW